MSLRGLSSKLNHSSGRWRTWIISKSGIIAGLSGISRLAEEDGADSGETFLCHWLRSTYRIEHSGLHRSRETREKGEDYLAILVQPRGQRFPIQSLGSSLTRLRL